MNSVRVLEIESEVLDAGWAAVMLPYDGPEVDVLNIRADVKGWVEFEVLSFFVFLLDSDSFFFLYTYCKAFVLCLERAPKRNAHLAVRLRSLVHVSVE